MVAKMSAEYFQLTSVTCSATLRYNRLFIHRETQAILSGWVAFLICKDRVIFWLVTQEVTWQDRGGVCKLLNWSDARPAASRAVHCRRDQFPTWDIRWTCILKVHGNSTCKICWLKIFNHSDPACPKTNKLIWMPLSNKNIYASFRLTHASDDAVHWKLWRPIIKSPDRTSFPLLLIEDEGWVLLFGDVDVVACVRGSHDVARARVQQDALVVLPLYADQTHAVPARHINITDIQLICARLF